MTIDFQGSCTLLGVFDMPSSLAFYCEVLGFEIVASSQQPPHCGWAMLRRSGTQLMLNTLYEDEHRPAVYDAARRSGHGDVCIYFDSGDPDSAYRHFQQHKIDARPPKVTNYGWKQVYVADPDGYTLCFHRPATAEEKT